LDLYLEEPCADRKQSLDILEWWNNNEFRFPKLSKMARDVLAIPVSTVASESAFSCGGRNIE
jgi:hAT family C-terminal dimerisation region